MSLKSFDNPWKSPTKTSRICKNLILLLADLCDNSDPRDVTTLISELVEGHGPGNSSGVNPSNSPSLVIDGKSVSSLYKAVLSQLVKYFTNGHKK